MNDLDKKAHRPSPDLDQQIAEKMRALGEGALAELRRRGMSEEEIQALLSRGRKRKPRA
jgi:hypothetical protein